MKENDTPLNPFPGLRPFGSDEDHLFFGREAQIDALLRQLRRHRFLAVVGASGSGKSSLVRAGLLPALHGGLMAGVGSHWRIALMRPGGNPISAMAAELTQPDVFGLPDADEQTQRMQRMMLQTTLRRSSLGLVEVVEQARMPPGENLLLVVDQFEELFRFARLDADHEDAPAFVKLLLEAVRTDRVPIYVVLTMRSDFIGDCSQFRDLPELMNDAQFLVPRLTRDQRQQAIMGPVAVGGAHISGRLVQRLLNDVGNNPDQLPVMQHALMRTWQQWQDSAAPTDPLDVTHYDAIGGMQHALSQHADETHHALPSDAHRTIAEALFKRLTYQDTDTRGIRRPTRLDTLSAVCGASEAEIRTVVEAFRRPDRSFLMPPAEVPLATDTIIDISHESLMRVWDRLHDWVQAEAESAYMYRRLAEAARLHAMGHAGLWNDPELQLALEWQANQLPSAAWAASYGGDFEQALAFLDESKTHRDAEIRRQEARRREALEQARALANAQQRRAEEQAAAAHRLRRQLFVTIALTILALAAAVFGLYSQHIARQESRLADSQRLAVEVLTRLDTQLDLALLLGVEAFQTEDTPSARSALQAALEHSPHLAAYLHGHTGSVLDVAYHPDGTLLASAGRDSTIRLWDVAMQRLSGPPLIGHRAAITSLAFNPDGSLLASASEDHTIRLWNTATGTLLDSLTGHTEAVMGVAFSPDGTTLASGSYDSTIRLWDIATRQVRQTLTAHDDAVLSIAFSPDGTTLASGSYDSTIRLWDVATGQPTGRPLNIPSSLIYSVALNPDGALLASGSDDGLVRIWDLATNTVLHTLSGHRNAVYSVAFNPDDSLLASASWDNTVLLWDVGTGQQRGEALIGHEEYVSSVTFSPDSQSLASGSYDNTVILWNTHTGLPRGEAMAVPSANLQSIVQSVAFSPDGTRLAAGNGDNTLLLWDTATRQPLAPPLRGHRSIVNSVAFSPDGRTLASASLDNTVRLWDVATRTPLDTLEDHQSPVLTVAFSPDGSLLASAGWEGTIILWDLATRTKLVEMHGHTDAIWSLAFSPDGTRLVSGSRDKTVRVWDVAQRLLLRTLKAHLSVVYGVAYNPDGTMLASGSGDTSIILWDTNTWKPLLHLTGHKASVQSLTFCNEGTHLASGSWDRTVRIWDVATGAHIWQLTGHDGVVNSVAYDPTDERLASGGWDQRIILWPLHAIHTSNSLTTTSLFQGWQQHREKACRLANRNLTEDEWTLIFGANTPYRATCSDTPG